MLKPTASTAPSPKETRHEQFRAGFRTLIGVPGDRLVDTLHNTLVEAILHGRIGANGRLYPGEIASLFGVSSTPVREALMRLATEGFVQAVPRRGFHLTDPYNKRDSRPLAGAPRP